jgi:transposase
MLTSGVVLLHDNVRQHTAARTRALLEHFDWELFDHPPYNPHLTPSDYHLFTYLKNWLGSQRFRNNELMKGIKTWLSSQAATSLTEACKKLFRDTRASVQALNTLRSSLSMYFLYITKFFSCCLFR